MKRLLFCSALASGLLSGSAQADTLKLRDGRSFEGNLLGASRAKVRFQFTNYNNQVRDIGLDEVAAIVLGQAQVSTEPTAAKEVTVPAGSTLAVSLPRGASSRGGNREFVAVLERDLVVGDVVVARAGSEVLGSIVSEKGQRRLALGHLAIDGRLSPLQTGDYAIPEGAATPTDAEGKPVKVQLRGKGVAVPPEQRLDFVLAQPVTAQPTRLPPSPSRAASPSPQPTAASAPSAEPPTATQPAAPKQPAPQPPAASQPASPPATQPSAPPQPQPTPGQ